MLSGIKSQSNAFDFQLWINQHDLAEIRGLLEEFRMCSLESLSTDNPNFLKLVCDDRFIKNSHLMRNIIDGINSLKDKQKFTVSYKQRVNIENKLQDLDNLCNEQQLLDDYQFQRYEQLQNLNKLKQNREKEIDEMQQKIDDEFDKIYGILRSKKTALTQKINAFKITLNEFIEYKRKEIKQFDTKISAFCSQKYKTKQHFQQQLDFALDLDPENEAKLLEINKNYDEIHKFMNISNISPYTEYRLDLIESNERFQELKENIRNCMFIKSFDEKLNLKPSRTAQIRKIKAHKKTLMDENMRLKISLQTLKTKINQQDRKLKMVQKTLNVQLFNKPNKSKNNQRDDQKNEENVNKEIKKKIKHCYARRGQNMNMYKRGRIDGPSEAALEWRRSQIEIGMKAIGYKHLIQLFPNYGRNMRQSGWKLDFEMIQIPKIDVKVGKKRWTGKYMKWRQFLHKFDDIDVVKGQMKN